MPKWSCANHPPERRHMQGRCLEHWAMWKRMGNTRGCGMLWSVPPYKSYLTTVLQLVAHLSGPQTLCCFLGPSISPSRPPNKCMWHREHGPKLRLWWHALEICETWHWTWSILRGKRALWLSVSVWIYGSAVYTLLSATDRRWDRQCLRKPYLHRKKTPEYWQLGDIWAAFYFILFLRRGILLPAGECTKCFSPVTSQGNHRILSYFKESKTKHCKRQHFFFPSSLSSLLLFSLPSFIPPHFPFPPYHRCPLWFSIISKTPSRAFWLLHCLSPSLWSPNH